MGETVHEQCEHRGDTRDRIDRIALNHFVSSEPAGFRGCRTWSAYLIADVNRDHGLEGHRDPQSPRSASSVSISGGAGGGEGISSSGSGPVMASCSRAASMTLRASGPMFKCG